MTLYTDRAGNFYILIRRSGTTRRKGKKKIRVRGVSYFRLVKKARPSRPFRPSRLFRRPVKPFKKKAVRPLKPPAFRVRPGWKSRKQWLFDLQRRYGKIDWSRSEEPRKLWAHVREGLTLSGIDGSFSFLSPRRKLPPWRSGIRYISSELWIVVHVQDEEEGEESRYLWVRRYYTAQKVSAARILRYFSRHDLERYTFDELRLRLPVSWRVRKGLLWKDAWHELPGQVARALKEINALDYGGETRALFAGFALYTEAGQKLR